MVSLTAGTAGSVASTRMPEVFGAEGAGQGCGELRLVVLLAQLAQHAAGHAQGSRAADDGRREDDAEHDTTDDAPLEALLGAVVGDLLDDDLAVGIGANDEHAVDDDVAGDLGIHQRLVGREGRIGVGELGHQQGMVGIGGDDAGGLHATAAVHGDGFDDGDVVTARGGLGLFGHIENSSIVYGGVPADDSPETAKAYFARSGRPRRGWSETRSR